MQETKTPAAALAARLLGAFAGVLLSGAALAADAALPQVSLKTTEGEIVLELNQEKAPKSVANILAYVKSGYYNGVIFHRVINGFMIQTGGYTADLKSKPTRPPVPIESKNGLTNEAYSVALARHDNPNSATSQFFINVANNHGLDYPGMDGHGYTVFGRVIKGYAVVDKIKGVLVDDKPMFANIPVKPIVVKSATILKTPIVPEPRPGEQAQPQPEPPPPAPQPEQQPAQQPSAQ